MQVIPMPTIHSMDVNFNGFKSKFPDQEARHDVARQLARNKLLEPAYATYLQLATHWGCDEPQLRELARKLYAVGSAMNDFGGQPVVVMEEGSLEDVFSDAPRLKEKLVANFGLIPVKEAERGIGHSFRHRKHGDRPYGNVKAKAPLIIPTAEIVVVESFRLEADSSEAAVQATQRDSLTVYEAAIPLDEERGGVPLVATDYTIIFGNKKFLDIARALQEKGLRPIEDKVGLSLDNHGKIRDTRSIARNLANWRSK